MFRHMAFGLQYRRGRASVLQEPGCSDGCYVVTQTMGVPDWKMKRDCVEDYYYAMPQYINPSGDMISRPVFFGKGGVLGFTPL